MLKIFSPSHPHSRKNIHVLIYLSQNVLIIEYDLIKVIPKIVMTFNLPILRVKGQLFSSV